MPTEPSAKKPTLLQKIQALPEGVKKLLVTWTVGLLMGAIILAWIFALPHRLTPAPNAAVDDQPFDDVLRSLQQLPAALDQGKQAFEENKNQLRDSLKLLATTTPAAEQASTTSPNSSEAIAVPPTTTPANLTQE